VTTRHEQGAAFAADGYARVSGRPAACLLSYGPGLLNGLTAIATARADRIPLLVLATAPGAADRARPGHVHQSPWQEELVRQLDVPVVAATAAAGLAAGTAGTGRAAVGGALRTKRCQ